MLKIHKTFYVINYVRMQIIVCFIHIKISFSKNSKPYHWKFKVVIYVNEYISTRKLSCLLDASYICILCFFPFSVHEGFMKTFDVPLLSYFIITTISKRGVIAHCFNIIIIKLNLLCHASICYFFFVTKILFIINIQNLYTRTQIRYLRIYLYNKGWKCGSLISLPTFNLSSCGRVKYFKPLGTLSHKKGNKKNHSVHGH